MLKCPRTRTFPVRQNAEPTGDAMSLIPQISPRFEALIELTRESFLLEERLRPITAEMNSYPLRVTLARF